MYGTIINVDPIFMGRDVYRVNITVMVHSDDGFPKPDVRAGFYVNGEGDIPPENSDVDLFYDNHGHLRVAFEGHWHEDIRYAFKNQNNEED